MTSFVFVILSFIGTHIVRRIGWMLSRRSLYSMPSFFAVAFCITWGGFIAGAMYFLIGWLKPYWLIKWIFGYAQGAYASVPNYGLFAEGTIPPDRQVRHLILSALPVVSYIAMAVLLAIRVRT